jgi:septal ring factor EnvC (AmiA/AmiB activator)
MTDATMPTDAATFVAALSLLAAAADVPATRARIHSLQKATDAAVNAQAKLAAERTAFDEKVTAARAELAEREKAVCAREVKVAAAEGLLVHRERVLAERADERDRRNGRFEPVGPGGVVRDYGDPDQRNPLQRDPHFGVEQ